MNKLKHIIFIFMAAVALSMTGCSDDFLETGPTNAISEDVVSESLENLYLAVNGIQRKLISQDGSSQGMGGEPGFGMARDTQSDDLEFNTKTNGWHRDLQRWTAQGNIKSSYIRIPWQVYYMRILNANQILKSVDKFQQTGGDLYKQVKAEALTFRAHSHFMLVQCYGKRYVAGQTNDNLGVPYRTTPVNEPMARNTVKEVYDQVNKDLDEAIQLIDGISLKVDEPNHFNYASICGLKARVALAMQNYDEAADYADKAIAFSEKKGVKLFTPEQIESCPTTSLFADISTAGEMIWGAMTKDDQTIYFYSFYAYMSWNFNSSAIRQAVKCINSNLYDTMSETDTRRCWWDPTGNAQTPKSSFVKRKYQNRKFTARHTSNAVGDYAFMRLAELYLMKAEALARAEKYAEAQEIFTRFQVTRDPAYVAKGNTGDALIAEIMNSRWVELWGEGFNWLDHKRLGLPVDRSNSNFDETACLVLEVNADDNRWQWAIPEQERNCNPLLEQNPL